MSCRDWPVVRLFFSGFEVPGPLIAKVSRLWKLYHLLRGDYRAAVRRLHERYGPLVQIAPHEYSLSDKSLVYVPNLHHTSSIVLPSCQHNLARTFRMANLYSAESQIDSCNESLFALIMKAGDKGDIVDMPELLTRYAHEVMLACTVGQRAGFLEHESTEHQIDMSVLKNWKFYAILHGSYLRYHPFIASMIKRWHVSGGSSAQLMMRLMPSRLTSVLGSSISSQSSEAMSSNAELETCIALTMAAADPTVALITTALHYIYSTPNLLEKLRAEIAAAQLSPQPTFKELILSRPSMPTLHAVLLECTRLHPPYITGPEYRSANGEVDGEQKIPPGSTIALEPTMIHNNPGRFGDDSNVFNPMRWLDASLACDLQRALLAFNISDMTNIEATILLIASKIITRFTTFWDSAKMQATEVFTQATEKFTLFRFYLAQGIPRKNLGVLLRINPIDSSTKKAENVDAATNDGAATTDGTAEAATDTPADPAADTIADTVANDTAVHTSTDNTIDNAIDDSIDNAVEVTTNTPAETAVDPATSCATEAASIKGDSTSSTEDDNDVSSTASLPKAEADVTISTSGPDSSSNGLTHVAAASSPKAEVSSGASATSSSHRGSGSSKASFNSAGNRTTATLPAANQLATILGEDDANELLNGRFAPSRKNFLGTKALYTKPIPDAFLRRLVHKALEQTHGWRLCHYNNPDTNIMAIGLQGSIPRAYSKSKQQSGQGSNNKRPYNKNNKNVNSRGDNNKNFNNRGDNNKNFNNNRSGHGNQVSNRGGNPAPDNTTTARAPPAAGAFQAKWANFATEEGARVDYWKTAEGYAERQAKMATNDAATKAAGTDADAQPRFTTTFKQTNGETVTGKLGGHRKAINVVKY